MKDEKGIAIVAIVGLAIWAFATGKIKLPGAAAVVTTAADKAKAKQLAQAQIMAQAKQAVLDQTSKNIINAISDGTFTASGAQLTGVEALFSKDSTTYQAAIDDSYQIAAAKAATIPDGVVAWTSANGYQAVSAASLGPEYNSF